MKLAIPLLATAAAMGFAVAMPSTASAACVTGAVHHNFTELHCDTKLPAWWTPVRYKDVGGGRGFYTNSTEDDCEWKPPCEVAIYERQPT